MGLPNGVHHLAIATRDIKEQIEFFTEVCGCELVALYWMHGVEKTYHGFLKLNDSSYLAFVESPGMKNIAAQEGVSHAGSIAGDVAPGATQHLAFNVDTEKELLAMRDRVRSHGYPVVGPLYHGLCKSIYFAGPEGLMLEFATSEGSAIDADAWIDPEVVELAGISEEELKRYKNPPTFVSQDGAVEQPPVDPRLRPIPFPIDFPAYQMSDADVTAEMSESEPPVTPKS